MLADKVHFLGLRRARAHFKCPLRTSMINPENDLFHIMPAFKGLSSLHVNKQRKNLASGPHYLLVGQLFTIEQFLRSDELHICVWHQL